MFENKWQLIRVTFYRATLEEDEKRNGKQRSGFEKLNRKMEKRMEKKDFVLLLLCVIFEFYFILVCVSYNLFNVAIVIISDNTGNWLHIGFNLMMFTSLK